jgi:Predicted transcriptional regulators
MFYTNLKSVLAQKGITEAKLSRMANIPKTTICNWKYKRTVPKEDTVKKISEVLQCPIETLTGVTYNTTDMPPYNENRITLTDAARVCGKSVAFLASWLQEGNCPFGKARRTTNDSWDYFIALRRLNKWLAGEL